MSQDNRPRSRLIHNPKPPTPPPPRSDEARLAAARDKANAYRHPDPLTPHAADPAATQREPGGERTAQPDRHEEQKRHDRQRDRPEGQGCHPPMIGEARGATPWQDPHSDSLSPSGPCPTPR